MLTDHEPDESRPRFHHERALLVWFALIAAVWLGAALVRYGPLRVVVGVLTLAGFLLCAFGVVGFQERTIRDHVKTKWLVWSLVGGGALWIGASVWLSALTP